MLVPAVMVVMSLVYALAAYLRGRAVRQRLRAQGYAAPLWTHGTAAIDRESWPRSAVVGARAFSLGGLPNNGLAFNAPHPPRRYCANHPYIVRRPILKDRATTPGFSPACTLRTARIRIASSVAWSSLRASSCFMPYGITPDSAGQEKSAITYGRDYYTMV